MAGARQDDCGATWVNLGAAAAGPVVKITKKGLGNIPGNFFVSCIAAVLEFQYIFEEQNKLFALH